MTRKEAFMGIVEGLVGILALVLIAGVICSIGYFIAPTYFGIEEAAELAYERFFPLRYIGAFMLGLAAIGGGIVSFILVFLTLVVLSVAVTTIGRKVILITGRIRGHLVQRKC